MAGDDRSTSRAAEARAAGLAYLLTIAAGLFAEVGVRSHFRLDSAAVTAAALHVGQSFYRIGVLSDAVMLAAYVVVTALLYRLFRSAGPGLSAIAAAFSLIGIAMLAAALILLLAPLKLADPTAAHDALRLHGATYSLTGFFFGPYCLLIGLLAARSGLVPRLVGWLMMLAGAAFVTDATIDIAAPALARQMPGAVMLVSLVGEGTLALWLSVIGINRRVEEGR